MDIKIIMVITINFEILKFLKLVAPLLNKRAKDKRQARHSLNEKQLRRTKIKYQKIDDGN